MLRTTLPLVGWRPIAPSQYLFYASYAAPKAYVQPHEIDPSESSGDLSDVEAADSIHSDPVVPPPGDNTELVLVKDPGGAEDFYIETLPCEPQSMLGDARVDPFSSFPFPLDDLQSRLLDYFVHDYARSKLQMSYKFQPGMRYFQEVMGSAIELHAILTQAALALESLYASESKVNLQPLKVAALYHKGETIRAINKTLEKSVTQRVMSAALSLARDEARYGSPELAAVHLKAFRCMLESIGGRTKMTLPHLLIQVRMFEGTQPHPQLSALFDEADLPVRVKRLNAFLRDLRRVGITRSQCPTLDQTKGTSPPARVLQPCSLFHHLLSKDIEEPKDFEDPSLTEMHSTLAILIGIAAAWLHAQDVTSVRDWVAWRNAMLIKMGIERHDSVKNAQNLLLAGMNTKKAQEMGQLWFPMDMMNPVRYLSFARKVKLRGWLIGLLEGDRPRKLEKLDPFAFSYMTS